MKITLTFFCEPEPLVLYAPEDISTEKVMKFKPYAAYHSGKLGDKSKTIDSVNIDFDATKPHPVSFITAHRPDGTQILMNGNVIITLNNPNN